MKRTKSGHDKPYACRYDMCIEEEMGLEEGYKCPCQKCCQADGRVSDRYAVGGPLHFHEAHDLVQDDDGFGELFMPPSWKTCSAGKITWVQSAFQWQPGMVGMAWGNEPVSLPLPACEGC